VEIAAILSKLKDDPVQTAAAVEYRRLLDKTEDTSSAALARLPDMPKAKKKELKKDDISSVSLAVTGGLAEPEQKQAPYKRKRKLKKFDKTLYIRRDLVNTEPLLAWAKEAGFTSTLPADDMHVTVVYSKDPVDWENMGEGGSGHLFAYDTENRTIEQFGDAVVMTFQNADLIRRHSYLRVLGCHHSFVPYQSHVTITYAAPEDLDLSAIKAYDGPLEFGPEIFQEINTDWQDDLEEDVLKAEDEDNEGMTSAEVLAWHDAIDRIRDQSDKEYALQALRNRDIATLYRLLPVRMVRNYNGTYQVREEDLIKAEAALETLADQLNAAVASGGTVPIDTQAGLTTSRLISLGFLSQASDEGSTTYEVSEILDDKTCDVCQYMDGMQFDVAEQSGRLMQTLGTSDPDELASMAPWPDLEDLAGMTPDELQAAGYGSPPYHPNCRGMLVPASTKEPGELSEEGEDLVSDLLDGVAALGVEGDEVDAEDLAGWDDDAKTEALQGAIEDLDDGDLKDSAQSAYDDGDYDAALAIAETSPDDAISTDAETAKDWSESEIDTLMWARFEITDPSMFKEADDAFTAGDYDKAQKIVDDFKDKNVEKEDPSDDDRSPNAPKKKGKRQSAAGQLSQDYDDIKPDSSNPISDIQNVNDDGAPIDRI
jgi:hypothetical protein